MCVLCVCIRAQPQLKRKLLIPLNGIELYCSRDGTKATLDFANAETANRALRICNMAQSQVHCVLSSRILCLCRGKIRVVCLRVRVPPPASAHATGLEG